MSYCAAKAKLDAGKAEYENGLRQFETKKKLVYGTVGGHWALAQTTAVAQSMGIAFEHITECCWNTAMNMMYSDYCAVAAKHGVGTPEFYGDMAKAFLFDKDAKSPNAKMAAYYCGIVDVD